MHERERRIPFRHLSEASTGRIRRQLFHTWQWDSECWHRGYDTTSDRVYGRVIRPFHQTNSIVLRFEEETRAQGTHLARLKLVSAF